MVTLDKCLGYVKDIWKVQRLLVFFYNYKLHFLKVKPLAYFQVPIKLLKFALFLISNSTFQKIFGL